MASRSGGRYREATLTLRFRKDGIPYTVQIAVRRPPQGDPPTIRLRDAGAE